VGKGIEPPTESGQAAPPSPAPDGSLSTRRVEQPTGRARPREGKLRKASSAILDGATYDPSVRFLLVAALLFVAFLVILFLSKFIT